MDDDFPFAVLKRRAAARQQRAEHVWTMRKDASVMRAELRSHGSIGVELQIWKDGALNHTRWYPSHEVTLQEAEERRQFFERDGWKPENPTQSD